MQSIDKARRICALRLNLRGLGTAAARLPLCKGPALGRDARAAWLAGRDLEAGILKQYPEPAQSQQGDALKPEQEVRTFSPVPLRTAADGGGAMSTMRRELAEHLYLLIKQQDSEGQPMWTFPTTKNAADESISETAQRALYSTVGKAHPVFFIGNVPMAHLPLRQQPGTVFFMLAQVVDDPWDVKLQQGSGAEDFAWVTKAELGRYLGDARLRDLVTRML